MIDICIVVPTYWTWGSERPGGPVEAVFDHPTPVDGEGTLPCLLDSLLHLEPGPPFRVLVLVATVHPSLANRAQARVNALITPFRERYPVAQFGAPELAVVRDWLPALGFDPALLALNSYAGVRNCQLLVPHVLGARVIVALDDDEVVAPNYLHIATEQVGRAQNGELIAGIAGFYENADGGLLLAEKEATGNLFLDKARVMNESARAFLAASGRLLRTPVAFGGNMVFHHSLFAQVGFDPGITRGEDLDYVLNARFAGFSFWLDRALRITHLPPHRYDTAVYVKRAEDVRRFFYEQEKLRLAAGQGLPAPTLAELSPYPGRFLSGALDGQARDALRAAATPSLVRVHGTPDAIVAQAQDRARQLAPAYFDFAQTWPRLMRAVRDRGLRGQLAARLGWRINYENAQSGPSAAQLCWAGVARSASVGSGDPS